LIVAPSHPDRRATGVFLQRKDSDLALQIITTMREQGVVCLPIHDSFIVTEEHRELLRQTMVECYQAMFHHQPVIDEK
jgi:hypothetical protein